MYYLPLTTYYLGNQENFLRKNICLITNPSGFNELLPLILEIKICQSHAVHTEPYWVMKLLGILNVFRWVWWVWLSMQGWLHWVSNVGSNSGHKRQTGFCNELKDFEDLESQKFKQQNSKFK